MVDVIILTISAAWSSVVLRAAPSIWTVRPDDAEPSGAPPWFASVQSSGYGQNLYLGIPVMA